MLRFGVLLAVRTVQKPNHELRIDLANSQEILLILRLPVLVDIVSVT